MIFGKFHSSVDFSFVLQLVLIDLATKQVIPAIQDSNQTRGLLINCSALPAVFLKLFPASFAILCHYNCDHG